jgi:hypothetical protein
MFNLCKMHPIINHGKPVWRKAYGGYVLAQFALVLIGLIGFLGYAIYYGQVGLLQNELQKNANMAALVGAAAMYDGASNAGPVRNDAYAVDAANRAFNRAVGASPAMGSIGAAATLAAVQSNRMVFAAEGTMPTPFFSLVGISSIKIGVTSMAAPAKEVITNIGALSAANPFRLLTLKQPVVDGPGPDMLFIPSTTEGYIPEVCAGANDCYPISFAARPGATGQSTDKTLGGRPTRLLYGRQYVDLGATQANYASYVNKGNTLKLTHDGVDDVVEAGTRYLYIKPPATISFGTIEVYHHSVLCGVTCTYPGGFLAM